MVSVTAQETPDEPSKSALEVQALVLEMADDYIAALGEAIYASDPRIKEDRTSRWLAQSFLRNGVGAAVDVATGPNPDVAVLDMVVLVSLETWSFERHWIPAGIGEDRGAAPLSRLRKAEAEMWETAARILSEEQRVALRDLIEAWIEANPDRMVVSLVRFDEFTDARQFPAQTTRGKASRLLRQVREATIAVEEMRLLGERLLWFAGRYPYILGEQAELTAYRLADQPELRELEAALGAARRMSESITSLVDRLPADPLGEGESTISRLTSQAIAEAFDRFAEERVALLEDLASRQEALGPVLQELSETIRVSVGLAEELTKTAEAVDKVVARFQPDPDAPRQPLSMVEARDAAVEIGNAAEKLTVLLERTNETLDSSPWDTGLTGVGAGVIDRAFWRGLILVIVFLGGLALIKWIPRRA